MSTIINWRCVPCHGEAHSNPHIDNCGICAPLWEKIVIPMEYVSIEDFNEAFEKMNETEKKKLSRLRMKEINRLRKMRNQFQ